MSYLVVSCDGLMSLCGEVEDHALNGYRPLGGIALQTDEDGHTVFHQAMWREGTLQ